VWGAGGGGGKGTPVSGVLLSRPFFVFAFFVWGGVWGGEGKTMKGERLGGVVWGGGGARGQFEFAGGVVSGLEGQKIQRRGPCGPHETKTIPQCYCYLRGLGDHGGGGGRLRLPSGRGFFC